MLQFSVLCISESVGWWVNGQEEAAMLQFSFWVMTELERDALMWMFVKRMKQPAGHPEWGNGGGVEAMTKNLHRALTALDAWTVSATLSHPHHTTPAHQPTPVDAWTVGAISRWPLHSTVAFLAAVCIQIPACLIGSWPLLVWWLPSLRCVVPF